jgi:hypothetical protein
LNGPLIANRLPGAVENGEKQGIADRGGQGYASVKAAGERHFCPDPMGPVLLNEDER